MIAILKYWKIILPLIVITVVVGYIAKLKIDNTDLLATNSKLTETNVELETTLVTTYLEIEDYNEQIEDHQGEVKHVNEIKKQALETITTHDLDAIAISKPQMLERRINKASESLWKEFEGL